MTQVHCEFRDCDNNEEGLCRSPAIRISAQDCCLTYKQAESGANTSEVGKGDKQIWDREYFEDDTLDDDFSF